ncbi:uncharacterized protein BX663DRAFT_428879 [Cokeromyces recurvatus]|uniref:uncharacterized protein n=1 Tax=Cokeromyces recurvatus TaxID=90255 RepID=UPI00221FAEBC|nr:uncharacterized protein BX663DRAFT_428879 [Cokeromyces recurvatus]KAI7906168.1 hypothetical protein BX663DRAFT_428879 [Cokeromyces recurvatus]
MKGDEFRSWILVYSPILLKGRLTGEHMINWMRFVDANRILASPSITHYEVNQAHNLLVEFVRTNVMLYGEDFITPNMHFHLHIHQTIEDFGPLYSTWLYSFERTNGDIKAIDINYKEGLEFTYMEKYIQQVHMQDYINILPSVISSNPVMMNTLRLLLPNNERQAYDTNDGNEDDMMETDNSEMHSPTTFDVSAFLNNAISASIVLTGSEPLPPSSYPIKTKKEVFMNSDHYECLFQFYSSVYGNFNVLKMSNISSSLSSSSIIVSNLINKFDQINILGQQFTSLECRNRRGIYIQAMTPAQEGIFRIGRILYFFTHELSFPNDHSIFNTRSTKKHVFAFVQWYQPSSQEFTSFYPHHVEVWKRTFEPISALSILPVQQINTCVAVTTYVDNNILAIPLPRRIVGV